MPARTPGNRRKTREAAPRPCSPLRNLPDRGQGVGGPTMQNLAVPAHLTAEHRLNGLQRPGGHTMTSPSSTADTVERTNDSAGASNRRVVHWVDPSRLAYQTISAGAFEKRSHHPLCSPVMPRLVSLTFVSSCRPLIRVVWADVADSGSRRSSSCAVRKTRVDRDARHIGDSGRCGPLDRQNLAGICESRNDRLSPPAPD